MSLPLEHQAFLIQKCDLIKFSSVAVFVAFVEDNATIGSIRYFENHVSYYVQNRRK